MIPAEAKKQPTEELLKSALERFESGDRVQGWRLVKQALLLDPGIGHTYTSSGNPIRANLQRILREARLPSTLQWLSAISRTAGDDQSAKSLLEKYAEVTPHAGERKPAVDENRISFLKRSWSWFRLKIQ